jgi:hypothetical protein
LCESFSELLKEDDLSLSSPRIHQYKQQLCYEAALAFDGVRSGEEAHRGVGVAIGGTIVVSCLIRAVWIVNSLIG